MQVSTSVGLPEETMNKLKALAIKTEKTRNRLIREGVDLILAKYGDKQR